MTEHASFKRRIRDRMTRTGERYTTARQVLLDRANGRGRTWVSEPEISDETVTDKTGRSWDAWCDLIDGWAVEPWDHAAVAMRLQEDVEVDPWWSQTITGGYERITGQRLPYQRPDGSFTAGKSRTLALDGAMLRELLLDPDHRRDLFPDEETELRSAATTKAIRLAIGPGVALISIETVDPGRVKVTVSHDKLPTFDDVERWKFYWTEWLEALNAG